MHFFALVDYVAAFYRRIDVGYFTVVQRNAALLNEPSRLAVTCANARRNKHGNYGCRFNLYFLFGQFAAAAESCARLRLSQNRFFFAVNEFGQLKS